MYWPYSPLFPQNLCIQMYSTCGILEKIFDFSVNVMKRPIGLEMGPLCLGGHLDALVKIKLNN